MATKTAKPETVNQYLAGVPREQRAALEQLRGTIKAAAPEATETISYKIPTFKYRGKHRDALTGYETSKGTIRFSADDPLPVALVKKLVKARIAENEARRTS